MSVTFLPGVHKLHNTNRAPFYVEESFLFVTSRREGWWNLEWWIPIPNWLRDELYFWLP